MRQAGHSDTLRDSSRGSPDERRGPAEAICRPEYGHPRFACALIKPSKSIHDVEVPGVRKKLKDKAFARGVNRDDVLNGAVELGIDLDQHITFCIAAMQSDADKLGLSGSGNR